MLAAMISCPILTLCNSEGTYNALGIVLSCYSLSQIIIPKVELTVIGSNQQFSVADLQVLGTYVG